MYLLWSRSEFITKSWMRRFRKAAMKGIRLDSRVIPPRWPQNSRSDCRLIRNFIPRKWLSRRISVKVSTTNLPTSPPPNSLTKKVSGRPAFNAVQTWSNLYLLVCFSAQTFYFPLCTTYVNICPQLLIELQILFAGPSMGRHRKNRDNSFAQIS